MRQNNVMLKQGPGPWINIIVGAHLNTIVGGSFELVGKN